MRSRQKAIHDAEMAYDIPGYNVKTTPDVGGSQNH